MSGVVIGFSGGVDSAVAAILLKEKGYNVKGLFLDVGVKGAREDAVKTAGVIGLEVECRDAAAQLDDKVCKAFLEGYLAGKTINPCLICNPLMKIKALADYADEIGFESISTGHYAISLNGALYEGCPDNDQSYQLSLITPSQLNRLILPLGSLKKDEVRKIARLNGVPIADKPDSMDICFIPDHDYAAWIERRSPVPAEGDAIFHGEKIGRHLGIHRYTVGQRWKDDYNGRRLYVSAIDPHKNEIELSVWEELFHVELFAENVNWLAPAHEDNFRARVRVRHTRWEMPECDVSVTPKGFRVLADSPLRAPAKGQTAALYVGGRVIGAGEIV